jgi:hypothetical protein
LIPLASPISVQAPDLAQILRPLAAAEQSAKASGKPKDKRRRMLDVGAVITRALTAAGLMK